MDLAYCGMSIGHMSNSIRQEFLEYIEKTGATVAEFSRRSGVSYDVLNKLKRREESSTSDENARKIRAAIAGVDVASEAAVPVRIEHVDDADGSATLVPVYDVHASAGNGSVVGEEAEVYSLAFPPSYLKRLTSSSPANLSIISVKGESMEPTLVDDDIVLLDTSKTNLSYDGLFVLRFDDALHVKRVGRAPKRGHVTIISDNKDLYPPMLMSVEEIDAVGKVLWYGRKV